MKYPLPRETKESSVKLRGLEFTMVISTTSRMRSSGGDRAEVVAINVRDKP